MNSLNHFFSVTMSLVFFWNLPNIREEWNFYRNSRSFCVDSWVRVWKKNKVWRMKIMEIHRQTICKWESYQNRICEEWKTFSFLKIFSFFISQVAFESLDSSVIFPGAWHNDDAASWNFSFSMWHQRISL